MPVTEMKPIKAGQLYRAKRLLRNITTLDVLKGEIMMVVDVNYNNGPDGGWVSLLMPNGTMGEKLGFHQKVFDRVLELVPSARKTKK